MIKLGVILWLLFAATIGCAADPSLICVESKRQEMIDKATAAVNSKNSKHYWISVATHAAGVTLDFISSSPTPGYEEVQPWMQSGRGAQAVLIGTSFGIIFGTSWAVKSVGHPKAATIMNYIGGGIHGGAAVWNFLH